MKLDEVDDEIVWRLVMDGRLSIAQLASAIGIAASTCHARVNALQAAGVIKSFHAEVDLDAVGLPFQALVMVRMRPQGRDELRAFAKRIIMLPQVMNLFFMAAAENFVVHVACASRTQLRDFVSMSINADPGIASTHTNLIFDHFVGAEHMEHLGGLAEVRRELT